MDSKMSPKLWATVTTLVAVVSAMGGLVEAGMGILFDLLHSSTPSPVVASPIVSEVAQPPSQAVVGASDSRDIAARTGGQTRILVCYLAKLLTPHPRAA